MDSDEEILVDEEVLESSPDQKDRPLKKFFTFNLEPMMFFIFFSMSFTSVIQQNQIIKTTCSAIFGYNETTCDLLGTENSTAVIQNIDTSIQPYVTKVIMTRALFDSITSATISLFIGSWSDKFGRKPVILAAVTGYFFSAVLLTLVTFLSRTYVISPWFYVLTAIPTSLMGGICSLLSGIYCYTADTTTVKDRPYRLALVGAYISLGLFLGSLACGYASVTLSATTIFAISAIIIFMVISYVAIFVEESLKPHQIDNSSRIRGFFQFALVKDMFKTFAERRQNRFILWIVIVVLCAVVFEMEGSLSVFFLFVRQKFSWTIQDYTTYDATSTIVGTVGGVGGIVVLQKILGFPPSSLALIGLGCSVINCVVKTFATKSWEMYLAILISTMRGTAPPMFRSIISNTIHENETGKIYALATSFEFLTGVAASPLYSYVYSATINSFPSAFNAVSAGIYLFCFILVSILFGYDIRNRSIMQRALSN